MKKLPMKTPVNQDHLHQAMRLMNAFAHTHGQEEAAATFCDEQCFHALKHTTESGVTYCCDCGVNIKFSRSKKGAEPDYVALSRTAFGD